MYLDCYAGPGLYSDGTEGSPALALATAEAVAKSSGKAELHGHLIEENRSSVEELRTLLTDHDARWDVYHGAAEQHLPDILDHIDAGTPVFAFIDPFGLPIPFDLVVRIMKRSGARRLGYHSSGAATEIMMNFSLSGIRRVGGQLTGNPVAPAAKKARATNVANMDAVLDGDWWHEIWCSEDPQRVDMIRQGYKDRLRKASKVGSWAVFDIPVSDRWQGPPAYNLLLFTQHEDGVWSFHENLSLAHEEQRSYCHLAQGLLDFEPLAGREQQWVEHIEGNIEALLAKGKFQPVYKIAQVYGDAFGIARQMHLRKALKNLVARKAAVVDTKGKLGERSG